jgi:hypothetical protein
LKIKTANRKTLTLATSKCILLIATALRFRYFILWEHEMDAAPELDLMAEQFELD